MDRRSFIATVGALPLITAGCVSQSDNNDPATTDDSNTPTDNGTGNNTSDFEPARGSDSRFADSECPSFTDSDRTVCYHTADDPDVVVEPSTELFEPSGSDDSVVTMQFDLRNRTDGRFGLNPYSWSIYQLTDNGWSFVAPEEHVEPWTELEPGKSYTWRLSVEKHTAAMSEDTMAIVEDLQSGVYAFQITGFGNPEADERTNVECVALFEVQRATEA